MKSSVYLFAIIFATWSLGETRDLGFTDRFSSWAHNLGLGKTVEEKAVLPVRRMVDGVRERFQRESPKDHLNYFVKRVESFLSKLVPSQNFVQDLMGLPAPEDTAAPPSDLSKEVSNILRSHAPKPVEKKPSKISHFTQREFPVGLKPPVVKMPLPPLFNFRPTKKVLYKPLLTKGPMKFPLMKPQKPRSEPMFVFNNGKEWLMRKKLTN